MTAPSAMTLARLLDTRSNDRGDDWRAQGKCLDEDPEKWFPNPSDTQGVIAAQMACAECPVLALCRESSLGERYGVWGGLSEEQRQRLRRIRGVKARP